LKLLVVKTTSMGDVVHALPAISDAARLLPGIEIDWMVEAPFAAVPALHPAVKQVWPITWRRWRKRLWDPATWRAMADFRRQLRAQPYDLVLDLQGLVKSALWAMQARGPRAGYDRASIWEPFASRLYQRHAAVSSQLHAIERCRRLAAAHLGYALPATPPVFGLKPPQGTWHVRNASADTAFAALIPCASRPEKLWLEDRWIALAQHLRERDHDVVVFWGSSEERARAERIVAACGGVMPPFLSVHDAAAVLGHARIVIGLDTGLTHLAAALGAATIGIYCDYDPSEAGVTGDGFHASIGGVGQQPPLADVMALTERALR
jgi:heptosyltransferase I